MELCFNPSSPPCSVRICYSTEQVAALLLSSSSVCAARPQGRSSTTARNPKSDTPTVKLSMKPQPLPVLLFKLLLRHLCFQHCLARSQPPGVAVSLRPSPPGVLQPRSHVSPSHALRSRFKIRFQGPCFPNSFQPILHKANTSNTIFSNQQRNFSL